MKTIIASILLLFVVGAVNGQAIERRRLSKTEIHYLSHKVDSIRKNLNRMIIYEKELRQKNYFLNEKTGLVDDLIATIQYLQQSVNVVDLRKSDIKKIFGKATGTTSNRWIYEFETYKSNCPFIEITFFLNVESVTKTEYRITDCQKWR